MPFMALMAAPLSAMLSVTGVWIIPLTRARTADNLFWRHQVSPGAISSLVALGGNPKRSHALSRMGPLTEAALPS